MVALATRRFADRFTPSRLVPSALVMKTAAAASLTGDKLPAVMFHVIWNITTAFGLRSRDGRFPPLNRHRARCSQLSIRQASDRSVLIGVRRSTGRADPSDQCADRG